MRPSSNHLRHFWACSQTRKRKNFCPTSVGAAKQTHLLPTRRSHQLSRGKRRMICLLGPPWTIAAWEHQLQVQSLSSKCSPLCSTKIDAAILKLVRGVFLKPCEPQACAVPCRSVLFGPECDTFHKMRPVVSQGIAAPCRGLACCLWRRCHGRTLQSSQPLLPFGFVFGVFIVFIVFSFARGHPCLLLFGHERGLAVFAISSRV